MENILKSPLARALLGLIALLIIGLAIWFIGPMFSFGDLKPLADLATRLWALGLLLFLIVLLVLSWTVVPVLVTLVCLLIWYAMPPIAFGSTKPFESVWLRALLIGVIVVAYTIYLIITLIKKARADAEFASWLFGSKDKETSDLAKDEIKTMQGITKQALTSLKSMRLGALQGAGVSALRRMVEGKRYLYELPWYMMVGRPGAGKTTVMLNSGLQFPTASISAQSALAKDRGTINCSWWFSNDAVMVDTAGRFTAQEAGADQAKNAAAWQGFLGVLRKARPRAPINGALLTIDVADIVNSSEADLLTHAATLRARLSELRSQLGIRFPVYVIVTKADLLKGFNDYFSSLTAESLAQVWGFTLPWESDTSKFKLLPTKRLANAKQGAASEIKPNESASSLTARIAGELEGLRARLEDGINTRLQEEFEPTKRTALYALPHEFGALSKRLVTMLDAVFADSRFDTTQLRHSLRGVYLTSCTQVDTSITAQRETIVARLRAGLDRMKRAVQGSAQGRGQVQPLVTGQKSYFANDVLTKIIFPEAHLVRPNLMWEARFRFLRIVGHALVGLIFFWLFGALVLSHSNNKDYLKSVDEKTALLAKQVKELFAGGNVAQVPGVLTAAQELPSYAGLDVKSPAGSFAYGLYTAPPIVDASNKIYSDVQDQFVVPVVVKRMEAVMRASLAKRDTKTLYDTLRVYLMFNEKDRYQASDVRAWVIKDWQGTISNAGVPTSPVKGGDSKSKGGAADKNKAQNPSTQNLSAQFVESAVMVGHLESLFSGDRVVQSASSRDEALVRAARDMLGVNSSAERLYERTKAAMQGGGSEQLEEFTLVRVLGPQAGTVFTRASGAPIEKGVSGLFTYDGYHNVFSKQVSEMIAVAQEDDAWVMGKIESSKSSNSSEAQKKRLLDAAANASKNKPLVEDIRRQYLNEYTQQWTQFLSDIRPLTGGNLSFDLGVLRQLAAPDSPIQKLARAAARETTLTRDLAAKADDDKSLFDKASGQLDKKSAQINKNLGLKPEAKLEKELVDNRFSSLREVVTGQGEGASAAGGAGGAKGGLEAVTGLLNEFYTVLVVADTSLSGNALPPVSGDVAAKLQLEAGKQPSPIKEIMSAIAANGAEKVSASSAAVLKAQAQVQLDRINALMNVQVSDACRRSIEGRYPFASSNQEVAIDDFNAVFAAGGAGDEFFNKFLLTLTDTSARPWRYKSAQTASMMVGAESTTEVPRPATSGPTLQGELLKLLAQSGPNLESFAQMAQIREAFFREAGGKRMALKLDVKVMDLDPAILELGLNFDGQVQRYAHGPKQVLSVSWPGPRGGTVAEASASPRIKPETSSYSDKGPWAIFRLFERARLNGTANGSKVTAEYSFDSRKVLLEITSAGTNPLTSNVLKNFKCPSRV
jgi:type VI secretion system protein ImpL